MAASDRNANSANLGSPFNRRTPCTPQSRALLCLILIALAGCRLFRHSEAANGSLYYEVIAGIIARGSKICYIH